MQAFRSFLGGIAAGTALLGVASSASATLLAHEPFDYAITGENPNRGADQLNGKNGGTGFGAAWGNQNADLLLGSFSYNDGVNQLVTSGNRALMDPADPNDANATPTSAVSPIRTLTTGLVPVGTQTVYLSVLAQQTDGQQRDLSVSLFAAANQGFGTQERVSVGHANGFSNWGVWALGNGALESHSSIPASQLSLLVVRVDLDANGSDERIRLYVNPTLGTEPLSPTVEYFHNVFDALSDINRIRMRGGNSNGTHPASWIEADEIRLGTTYAAVTPIVPEPGAAMLGLAGLSLIALRRRRRDGRARQKLCAVGL
jgi:MYXO-CTERM domain-containing protein